MISLIKDYIVESKRLEFKRISRPSSVRDEYSLGHRLVDFYISSGNEKDIIEENGGRNSSVIFSGEVSHYKIRLPYENFSCDSQRLRRLEEIISICKVSGIEKYSRVYFTLANPRENKYVPHITMEKQEVICPLEFQNMLDKTLDIYFLEN